MKVLPELLKSVEFGGGGPKVLGAIVKIGAKLSPEEYNARVTPVIVRLFANPDRLLRVSLLENLPMMIENVPSKVVNDKIFPHMVCFFFFFFWGIKILIHTYFYITDIRLYRYHTHRSRTNSQGCFTGN